jgi:hypothetical protein
MCSVFRSKPKSLKHDKKFVSSLQSYHLFFNPPSSSEFGRHLWFLARVQPLSVAHMQAGMQHPSLDGYDEVGVLGRG